MGGTRSLDDFLDHNKIEVPEDDELEHYGVPGMKWGIRRSRKQLARAARERGDTPADSSDSSSSEDSQRARSLSGRSASSLSNKELQELNNRLNLEEQYARLTSPKPTPASRRKEIGKKFMDKYIENEIGKIVKGDVKGTTTYRVGNAVFGKKYQGRHRG